MSVGNYGCSVNTYRGRILEYINKFIKAWCNHIGHSLL